MTSTYTIAHTGAALIAQAVDGDAASLETQIAEAVEMGLSRDELTIESGLLIGERADVEGIPGADICWIDSVPSLTGGDCAYRLAA